MSELPIGNHSVEAYVIWAYPHDASQNTAMSEEKFFSISNQSMFSSFFLIMIVIVVVGLVVVVAVFGYIRRCNHKD